VLILQTGEDRFERQIEPVKISCFKCISKYLFPRLPYPSISTKLP
jgi:hypothetical protein